MWHQFNFLKFLEFIQANSMYENIAKFLTHPTIYNNNNNNNNKLDLARELKKLWNMKVMVIPIVFGALGMVPIYLRVCPCGVMVKVLDCGIVVSEFELQLRYYVPFRTNTLGKGMSTLILPTIG